MNICRILLLILAITLNFRQKSFSEIGDVGLWTSISLKKSVTRNIDLVFSEELRLNNNMSSIDSYFSDLGIEYSLSNWKFSFDYRYINKNQLDYYSKRNRFYIDVSYKFKIEKIIISLRQRFQEQFTDYYTSETGKIPEWYSRTKIQVKPDLKKKYAPYLSYESYLLINNVKNDGGQFEANRYESGIEYEYNRMHQINIFFLLQQSMPGNQMEFVVGTGYKFTF